VPCHCQLTLLGFVGASVTAHEAHAASLAGGLYRTPGAAERGRARLLIVRVNCANAGGGVGVCGFAHTPPLHVPLRAITPVALAALWGRHDDLPDASDAEDLPRLVVVVMAGRALPGRDGDGDLSSCS